MATNLVLTVGTNPLPVWVAWHHLKDRLECPVNVLLVHTSATHAEMDRLKAECAGAVFLDPLSTSAGSPGTVRGDIRGMVGRLTGDVSCVHIHYTGGTKVMGVETVSAAEGLLSGNDQVMLETSYLDARGGPAIVSRRGTLVTDARIGVEADLKRIARLNGFQLGPFPYTYWDRTIGNERNVDCPGPRIPSDFEQEQGLYSVNHGRVTGESLEHGVYAAFRRALETIAPYNRSRVDYQLFHRVYVRRETRDSQVRPFELDVVAVLGYQVVVVSCTVDGRLDVVKHKGMEVSLRARQLGGDEARSIVLCGAHPGNVPRIEAELADETGSSDVPLQVWGSDTWSHLPNEFSRYLRKDLRWR